MCNRDVPYLKVTSSYVDVDIRGLCKAPQPEPRHNPMASQMSTPGQHWAWCQTAPPSLTARVAGGYSTRVRHLGNLLEEEKALASSGEWEWRNKHDTGQLFPPLTCYPTHGKKLAQRGDCKFS